MFVCLILHLDGHHYRNAPEELKLEQYLGILRTTEELSVPSVSSLQLTFQYHCNAEVEFFVN